MRKVALLGLGLVLLSGCDIFRPRPHRPDPAAVTSGPPAPPASQLVAYMNENARKLQAVQSTNVDLHIHSGLGVSLSGMLVCEKPRNFRLKAKMLGKPAADLGSNDEEFWFWNSRENPLYVLHCSYQDMGQRPIQLPIPFQPDMIVAAMGLADYDEGKSYEVKATRQTLELIEPAVTPARKRMRKITVFNRYETHDPKQPQVVAHILKDETGTELCSATIKEVTQDRASGAVLPRIVVLKWPAEKLEITLKMHDIQSTQLNANDKTRMFSRNNVGAGLRGFDMARGQPDDAPRGYSQGPLQRTSGQVPPPGGW